MNVTSATSSIWKSVATRRDAMSAPTAIQPRGRNVGDDEANNEKLRKTFQSFVGETLFGQMLKAARKTQNKPAYFHGGRTEEMFQQQLDQVLAEKIAESDGAKFSNAMFDLFTLKRG